jgi:EmrB/QacA subfamily drug resistance transporter
MESPNQLAMQTGGESMAAASIRLGPLGQFALLSGPLLSMIDASIVNVATPAIMTALHAPVSEAQWVASAYLLALGAGLSLTPWSSGRFEGARAYRACILLFVLTSAVCGGAWSLPVLIAARVLQGFVAGPMVPLAMGALMGEDAGGRRAGIAAGFALFAAPAFGPVLGGLLLQAGGWPLVFLINVPIGAAAWFACRRVPASVFAASRRRPVDIVGFALLAVGMTGIVIAGQQAPRAGWSSASALVPLVAGLAGLLAYPMHAARSRHPLVDLRALKTPVALTAVAVSGLATIIAFATVFLVPAFLQQVERLDPLVTGLVLVPAGLLTALGAVAGDALAARSLRLTVAGGLVALAGSSLLLGVMDASTPLWQPMVILAARGAAIGLVTGPLVTALTRLARPELRDDTNTGFTIGLRVASSLGIAVLATVYGTASTPTAGLHEVGIVMTVAAVVGLPAVMLLPRRREDLPVPVPQHPIRG